MRSKLRSLVASGAAALLLAACGSSPTAPSSAPFNVAGLWTGTWQFMTSGATVTDMLSATFTQNGATASGSWTAASGASGSLTFTVGSSISGTWTIAQTTLTGQTCTASATFSGTASASSININISTPPSGGACQWATGNQFSLSK